MSVVSDIRNISFAIGRVKEGIEPNNHEKALNYMMRMLKSRFHENKELKFKGGILDNGFYLILRLDIYEGTYLTSLYTITGDMDDHVEVFDRLMVSPGNVLYNGYKNKAKNVPEGDPIVFESGKRVFDVKKLIEIVKDFKKTISKTMVRRFDYESVHSPHDHETIEPEQFAQIYETRWKKSKKDKYKGKGVSIQIDELMHDLSQTFQDEFTGYRYYNVNKGEVNSELTFNREKKNDGFIFKYIDGYDNVVYTIKYEEDENDPNSGMFTAWGEIKVRPSSGVYTQYFEKAKKSLAGRLLEEGDVLKFKQDPPQSYKRVSLEKMVGKNVPNSRWLKFIVEDANRFMDTVMKGVNLKLVFDGADTSNIGGNSLRYFKVYTGSDPWT